MDQAEASPDEAGGRGARPRVAGAGRGGEPGERAHEHHPLDAQVENPRPLGEDLAQGGKQHRGPRADGRREHRDRDRGHREASGLILTGVLRRITTRYPTMISPPRTKKKMSPCSM